MSRRLSVVLAGALLLGAGGCRKDEGEGLLHAREAALEREAAGLRTSLARLERGEPILPEDAVVVAVSEPVVKEFLDAQLPFEAETDRFVVNLSRGEAVFRGSPALRLTGSIWPTGHPDLVGEVSAQGALENIRVDAGTGILRAAIALDHVDLVQMGGLEKFVPKGSLNEVARAVRKQLAPRLPALEIPVRIQQAVELPSVTSGPVRLAGARMPLEVSVADVFAGTGLLWVAVKVVPGEFAKVEPSANTDRTPAAGSGSAPTAPPASKAPAATPSAKGGPR
jgi:hypothetical protein